MFAPYHGGDLINMAIFVLGPPAMGGVVKELWHEMSKTFLQYSDDKRRDYLFQLIVSTNSHEHMLELLTEQQLYDQLCEDQTIDPATFKKSIMTNVITVKQWMSDNKHLLEVYL